MNKPTEAQIKEFWEGIGWDNLKDSGIIKWINNKGKVSFVEKPPPIDLNNLFKYAIPRLDSWAMFKQPDGVLVEVSAGKVHEARIVHNDPVLALFWAIYAVVKDAKS